jgi:hypothetical protein
MACNLEKLLIATVNGYTPKVFCTPEYSFI